VTMNRNLLAALVGCLYVAGSVWLVRSMGKAYRDSLPPNPALAAVAGATDARPVPSSANQTVAEVLAPGPRSTPDAAVAVPSPPSSLPVAITAAPTEPAPAEPAGLSPFLERPPDAEIWNTRNLKPADEKRLGRALHELILRHHKSLASGSLVTRLEKAAFPLVATCARPEIEYRYTILESDQVFAFSHPGGYIYLSWGVFALIAGEAELQFIIGHEIAHVDLGHALKRLEEASDEAKQRGIGTVHQLYHLIAAGYAENQEFEADAWALERLRKLDRTPRECLGFLWKLEDYSRDHGFESGRIAPASGLADAVQDVTNHIRAQPAAWKRLTRLRDTLDRLNPLPLLPK
jgi:predicted Zn-dependent protease